MLHTKMFRSFGFTLIFGGFVSNSFAQSTKFKSDENRIEFEVMPKWILLERGTENYKKHYLKSIGVTQQTVISKEAERNLPQFVMYPKDANQRFEISILVKDIPNRPDVTSEIMSKVIADGYISNPTEWMKNPKIIQETKTSTLQNTTAANSKIRFDANSKSKPVEMILWDWVIARANKLYIIGLSGPSKTGYKNREAEFQKFLSSIKFL